MMMRDLVPWGRTRAAVPAPRGEETSPFLALHREMNRLFDDFFRGFDAPMGLAPFGLNGTWPRVEVDETEKDVKVVAELPGMSEKDVQVTLHDGLLTLKGERNSETNGATYSERWQGRFERSLQLGSEVDPDKVDAAFKNGVLTITVGKRPEAQSSVKRIPIKA
jgi:HSP20 family protein